MILGRKYKKLLLSLFIIAMWLGLILIISSNNTSKSGGSFNLFVWFILTRYVALITGCIGIILAIILRITKNLKYTSGFIYILIGALNSFLGIFAVIYFNIKPPETPAIHDFIPNLLVGVLIMIDIFFLDTALKG